VKVDNKINKNKMETSIFIAKFLGVAYIIFGLGILLNTKYYKKMLDDLIKNSANVLYGGIFALVVGFLIIYYHNIWVASWTVVITIIGWLGLLKGFLLIVFPNFYVSWTKALVRNESFMPIYGFLAFLLGLYFIYFGFFA